MSCRQLGKSLVSSPTLLVAIGGRLCCPDRGPMMWHWYGSVGTSGGALLVRLPVVVSTTCPSACVVRLNAYVANALSVPVHYLLITRWATWLSGALLNALPS